MIFRLISCYLEGTTHVEIRRNISVRGNINTKARRRGKQLFSTWYAGMFLGKWLEY
jgi:hypothetical protein